MSNHKAHFRGDLQVDGSIVGPDGQPVGGSVDVSGLLPVDGSRAMTAPIHFAGGDNGEAFGPNLGWDEDQFGLRVWPQPGHSRYDNFVDIYMIADGDTGNSTIDISVGEYYAPYIHMEQTPSPSGMYSNSDIRSNGLGGYSQLLPGSVDDASWNFGSGDVGEAQLRMSNSGDRDFLVLKQLLDNEYRFEIGADAALHWGGGAAAPDVSLERIYEGGAAFLAATEMDFLIGVGPAANIYDQSWIDLYNNGNHSFVALGDASGNEVVRFASTLGGVPGILVCSPDGTAYKLTPPNGGGPAEWVAA